MGKSNALFASTHPCYIGGGYKCDCGYISLTAEDHRNHVYDSHIPEYAIKVLPYIDYIKHYDPIKYEELLNHRSNMKKFRAFMKKKGYVYHRFMGWYDRIGKIYLSEEEVDEIKKSFKI